MWKNAHRAMLLLSATAFKTVVNLNATKIIVTEPHSGSWNKNSSQQKLRSRIAQLLLNLLSRSVASYIKLKPNPYYTEIIHTFSNSLRVSNRDFIRATVKSR